MSLIVARKEGTRIAVVSDTKLTYPGHEIKRLKDDPKEGVIKSIILNENLCVSFAGEIDHAENAFIEIGDTENIKGIINILYKHHQLSNFETEFLICSGNPVPLIHKVKNSESKEVQSAWIGDSEAFNSFQESMMGVKKNKDTHNKKPAESKANITISEMNLSFHVDTQMELFSKMSSAMDETIEDNNIESVGGFKVGIVYNDKFDYVKYGTLYRGTIELFGYGGHTLGHGSAQEGAYSIHFIGASTDFKNLALHVRQGNFGLLYKRTNNGLLRPELHMLDEVDFLDYIKEKYKLEAAFVTQDRVQKFTLDGKREFDKKEFTNAKNAFEKALLESKGIQQAEILFYIGICLLNLRDINTAMSTFQQAIKIDNSYYRRVMQVLNQRP